MEQENAMANCAREFVSSELFQTTGKLLQDWYSTCGNIHGGGEGLSQPTEFEIGFESHSTRHPNMSSAAFRLANPYRDGIRGVTGCASLYLGRKIDLTQPSVKLSPLWAVQ